MAGHTAPIDASFQSPPEPAITASDESAGRACLMLGKSWFPAEIGGLDRFFTELYLALESLGYPTRAVVVGPAPGASRAVHGLSASTAPLPLRLLAYAAKASSLARSADLVDAHFALYSLLPVSLTRVRRLPLLVHFHGPWAAESAAAGQRGKLNLLARRRIERAVYRRAERVIVLSGAFRRLLAETYRVDPWRIDVEAPGVDTHTFSPGDRESARAALELPRDAFVAVAVRRLVPRMGMTVLLDAWAQAKEELGREAVLAIAGDGSMRHELMDRARSLGLDSSVRLLGRVADEDVVRLFRAADVNVVPSLELEGFGLIVLEAAGCGTPSLVTDVGGLPDTVRGLDPSLVVRAGEPKPLAARLVAARNGGLPERGDTRRHAERFSWSAAAERTIAIHDEARRRTRRAGLKVAYLDHVARWSGGEIALARLLPHLDGVSPHVILAEDGPLVGRLMQQGTSVEVLALAAEVIDIRKERVLVGAHAARGLAPLAFYVLRLARRLREISPQIIHANSLKSGIYGALAARMIGVPFVWHLRDRLSPDYLPPAAIAAVRAILRRTPDAVIANSPGTLELAQVGGRGIVVPEVIELPDTAAGPLSAPQRPHDRPLTVGLVGRLAPWKGQDVFLDAFARAFAGGDERGVIVGSALFGEEDYAKRLESHAAELGLNSRVEFRGFRDDVWQELAGLDVLVHASTVPEPFGQVVLEGLAAGVPVIATREGGPGEILEHGRTGLLYPAGDVDALAAALRDLGADGELRRALADRGRQRAQAFAPKRIAPAVRGLYDEILERRAA